MKDRATPETLNIISAELIDSCITPTGWVLLVNPDTVGRKTKSDLIHIPESAATLENAAQPTGVLCAIGPLAWKKQGHGGIPWAAVGDRVYFGKYAGLRVKEPGTGRELLLLNDDDLMGVVKTKK